jgi:excisionase family DNA binding protein
MESKDMKKRTRPEVEKIAHSLAEAAEMTGLSKGHLRNEYKRGKLHFTRSGRRVLVTDEELKRYLAEGSVKGTQLTLF